MRLVLDTNVLIAAFIARGACADLLEHCVANHSLVTSEFILGELREHLVGKFKFATSEADEAIALLQSQMTRVMPAVLPHSVCHDMSDEQIIGTAIAGNAQCIVMGDKDLLVLRRCAAIEIVSPTEFADYEKATT